MKVWRTLLSPGEQTYVWHVREPDGEAWDYRLCDTPLPQADWVRHPQWYTRSYQAALTIPPDAAPGDYDLSGVAVRVVSKPAPRPGRGNQLSWHRPEWYGPQAVFEATWPAHAPWWTCPGTG